MKLVKLMPDNYRETILQACQVLRDGGLVVYPTETTYGIGADCENPQAIEKLISYKSKRDGKPLSVAVATQEMAKKYVELNKTAENVYNTFLPGPVTVISKGLHTVAPLVESSTGTLGIRIPNYQLALDLISQFGHGITATGANASYQKRPYNVEDIFNNISDRQKELIDLVIDVGELPHNEPSTVIDTTLDDISVSRFGPVKFSDKEKFETDSPEKTGEVAKRLISRYRSKLGYEPLVIALTGPMGAGKTHFVKGIAEGLRIEEIITSPTYSLANEHEFISEGRKSSLIHVDTWKMESAADFSALELPSAIETNAVVVIEWADRFTDEITTLTKSTNLIWVDIKMVDENNREIKIIHNTK